MYRGLTGSIEFNEGGDRVESRYEIINIQQGTATVVGTYRSNTVSDNGDSREDENSAVIVRALSSKQTRSLLNCFLSLFRPSAIRVLRVEKL